MNINPLTNDQRAHCIGRIGEGLTKRNHQTLEDTLSDGCLRETYELLYHEPVPSDHEIRGANNIRRAA